MEIGKGAGESDESKLWKFAFGFVDSLVLRSAIELRLADIIHSHGGGPISLSDLSSSLPIPSVDTRHLRRLMRYLVHMEIFTNKTTPHVDVHGREADEEERYGLAPIAAQYLVTTSDKSIVPALLYSSSREIMEPYRYITDALRPGGVTAFEVAMGNNFWDYFRENPEMNRLFNEAMAFETSLLTSALLDHSRDVFSGVASLVDVGGGTGAMARAIAQAFPEMKCTVFDLPHVIADSDEYTSTPDQVILINRVKGDMFVSIPSADAILLKRVLHDWDDEECVKILKNCKQALPAQGGKVIIVEIVLSADDDRKPADRQTLAFDLGMLVMTKGKERTEAEWKKLILDAGFNGYQIKHISAAKSVILAFPHD
ncbi:hypothetical protein H6P81_010846 [Aristolochia fimbriata]|uniref:Uncharacterized protein n=1 Tax=Aristolochia fimbriata TaxID=158543 RepID=A0AAV7ESP2_ARIFI|nr:hypothetical protein H6P81_010846 [Aristolochia fimbriata]